MIALWLIVSHLVGDYLLQTRWQAVGKFGWTDEAFWLRARHVGGYTAAFVPVAAVYGWHTHGHEDGAATLAFLAVLCMAHFFTDAQRFTRTPGEWLAWKTVVYDETKIQAHTRVVTYGSTGESTLTSRPSSAERLRLPPNPWPSIGLAIDQTLHLIQIAVLAQVFLR